MTTKQMFMLIVGGIAVIGAAILFDTLTRDPNVPNDANIGAGLIAMIGFALIVIGIAGRIITALTKRRDEK